MHIAFHVGDPYHVIALFGCGFGHVIKGLTLKQKHFEYISLCDLS